MLSGTVYSDAPHVLPAALQERGWRHSRTITDEGAGLVAAWYVRASFCVMAVRGTEPTSVRNLLDDFQLAWGTVPLLEADLLRELRQFDCGGRSLVLTGHSLGAAAVNAAALSLAAEDERWLSRLHSVVLFENPGVPEGKIRDAPPRVLEALAGKTTEILGAPNPINMCQFHMGGSVQRLMIPHRQRDDVWHKLKCGVGFASDLLAVLALTNAAAGALGLAAAETAGAGAAAGAASRARTAGRAASGAAAAAEATGLAAARAAPGAARALSGTSLAAGVAFDFWWHALPQMIGVTDYAGWVLSQHGIRSIQEALSFGSHQERCKAMRSWPSGVASQTTLIQFVESLLPFHPTRHGIHNFDDPNRLVEERIRRIPDYEELGDSPVGREDDPEPDVAEAAEETTSILEAGLRRLAGELLERAEAAKRAGDRRLAEEQARELREVLRMLDEIRGRESAPGALDARDLYPD